MICSDFRLLAAGRLRMTFFGALCAAIAGGLAAVPVPAAAQQTIEASDPSVSLEWSAWSKADAVGRIVSGVIGDVPGYDVAVVDMNADGVGEILLRAPGCVDGEACDFTILRHEAWRDAWAEDLSFSSPAVPFVEIAEGEPKQYGLRLGDVVWVLKEDGLMPASPFARDLVGARPANAAEIGFIRRKNPEMSPDLAQGLVYEIDLDGDGELDRIIQADVMYLCMSGGSLCPFYVIDPQENLLAEGYTMDTPMVIEGKDGVHSLMSVGLNGTYQHHMLAKLR